MDPAAIAALAALSTADTASSSSQQPQDGQQPVHQVAGSGVEQARHMRAAAGVAQARVGGPGGGGVTPATAAVGDQLSSLGSPTAAAAAAAAQPAASAPVPVPCRSSGAHTSSGAGAAQQHPQGEQGANDGTLPPPSPADPDMSPEQLQALLQQASPAVERPRFSAADFLKVQAPALTSAARRELVGGLGGGAGAPGGNDDDVAHSLEGAARPAGAACRACGRDDEGVGCVPATAHHACMCPAHAARAALLLLVCPQMRAMQQTSRDSRRT
jgi:hypothetical protein